MAETAVVTLLFTDLVGSTALSQRLGEDGAELLRRDHTNALRETIAPNGGREVKHLGDGLMVVFSSPSEAARCAVDMQRSVDRHNRTEQEPLGLRVGIHIGEVTKEADDYFGSAVVIAERLCKKADGGQILVSDVFRTLVGTRGELVFVDVGAMELKGIDEPVGAYELGWEPSADESRIPFPLGFPQVDRLLFVGREDERERIRTAWKRAASGQPQLVLVAGEPGIGKTRLSTELAYDVHDSGAVVLYGRCDDEVGVPYQPFAEALSHLVSHGPLDVLSDHVERFGGELGRLAPDLQRRVTGAPPPTDDAADPQADRDAGRYRLFEAATALLETTAALAPVLLVLDDLHWASRPTLLLLRHVLRRMGSSQILIVGTYRDTDLARTHPFAETLADLRREMEIERISLQGLDEDGIAAFIEKASGQDIGDAEIALVRAVHAETEGNPFFVGQVLRHLVESGAIFERDGRWTYDGPVERLGIPEGVREVVGRRMSRLSEDANHVLGVASVMGAEFDIAVIERVPEAAKSGDVLDALDEAVAARIVDESPGSPGKYRFTHTLVKQTLYEELTSTRRVRLHQRVGEAIEEAFASDLEPHLAALARHFCEAARSGHIEKATDYALRAARQANARAAYEEAVAHAERGLQVLDLDTAVRLDSRADLLIEIAGAKTWLVDREGTCEAARAAFGSAKAAGAPDRMAWASHYFCGLVPFAEFGQAVDMCQESLASLGDAFPGLRSLMLSWSLWFGTFIGRTNDLEGACRGALEAARLSGDPMALSFALIIGAWGRRAAVGAAAIGPEEGLALANELIELGTTSGKSYVAQGFRTRGLVRLTEGDLPGFEADRKELERLAEELRTDMFAVIAAGEFETLVATEGRFADAEALLADLMDRWGSHPVLIGGLAVRMAHLHWERGQYEEWKRIALSQLQLIPRISGWHGAVIHCDVMLGNLDDARERLRSLVPDDFEIVRNDPNGMSTITLAAEACLVLGESEIAARFYELGLPHAGRFVVIGDAYGIFGAADRFLGILALACGRVEDAEAHFRAALDLEENLPSPPLSARAKYWLGRILLETGDEAKAAEASHLLDASLKTARELGMAGVEQQVTSLLAARS